MTPLASLHTDTILLEDSHSGRVRASRTRVDESLEGSNNSLLR
jgi:hypothetical protein